MSAYFQQLSDELRASKDRVSNLISHHQSEGEWRETLLRNFIRRSLPDNYSVGRGFVVSSEGSTSQIDIMVYDKSYPKLFQDADFAIVTADAVRAIVEAKTSARGDRIGRDLEKLTLAHRFCTDSSGLDTFCGYFAFVNSGFGMNRRGLNRIKTATTVYGHPSLSAAVFGENHFFKSFYKERTHLQENRMSLYQMERMAYGYFIHNLVAFLARSSIHDNRGMWFPIEGKEGRLIASVSAVDAH